MEPMYTREQNELMQVVKTGTQKDLKAIFKPEILTKDEHWFDYTLVLEALKRGHKGMINFLLTNNKCRVKREDADCRPLCYAIKLGDDHLFRRLLELGASINEKQYNKNSPLHLAMQLKNTSLVDSILYRRYEDFKKLNPSSKDAQAYFKIACMRSNLPAIQVFINGGFSPSSPLGLETENWHGYTPLRFAITNKSVETFEFLLDNNVDLRVKDSKGLTPLQFMYTNGYLRFFEKALLKHAERLINVDDKKELETDHHWTCGGDNTIYLFRILLDNGVDINSATHPEVQFPGYTPLHYAVHHQCGDLVTLLCQRKANLMKTDITGSTPLHLACRSKHAKPLFSSRRSKNAEIAGILLKHGADLTVKDDEDYTPLHYAFYTADKDDELIKLLLEHIPMDVNPTDRQGLSHFHIACTRNIPNQVDTFLQHGVSVNLCVNSDNSSYPGYSALHFAVNFNCKATIKLLLKRGADVNHATSVSKITPLHEACTHNYSRCHKMLNSRWDVEYMASHHEITVQIIELLLKFKGNVNAVDADGKTPLFYACNIIDLYPEFLHSAIVKEVNIRRKKIVEVLLQHNADIHLRFDLNDSLLHVLSKDYSSLGATGIARLLLKNGADVNARNKDSMTPLHVAAEEMKKEVVDLFLKHKANVHAKTGDKLLTPLQLAIAHRKSSKSQEPIIKMLLEYGSDANVCYAKGETLLHKAISSENTPAIKHLLRYGADVNSIDGEGRSTIFPLRELSKTKVYRYHGEMFDIVDTHLKKLASLRFHISELVREHCLEISGNYKPEFFYLDESNEVMLQCAVELRKMKKVRVDSYSTLYDILFKDANGMVNHLKNKRLVDILKDDKLAQNFPLFNDLLTLRYKRGKSRSLTIEPAKAVLTIIADCNLPLECSEGILRFLSDSDVENLVKVDITHTISNKRKLNDRTVNTREPSTKKKKLK